MSGLKFATRAAALGLAMLATNSALSSDTAPIVQAPAGKVRGVPVDGLNIFKGIPYAQAPVGEMRWKPPAPLGAWDGVRDATQFGAACQQPGYPAGSIYAESYKMSEDCLFLNIWSPAKAKNAPVFLWIHGGNLIRGSSSQGLFDGAALAKRGIVVVSINYRLGIFGYFAHRELSAESPEGISGNYGVQDQIAALQWVKRNIASFGGNAKNVTIAGESAGGLAILHMLASPRAHGLFSKAIVQSASLMNLPELKQERFGTPSAETLGDRIVTAAGVKGIKELRAIDGANLTAIATKAGFGSTAIVDGKIIPRQLIETFERGEQAKVPLMTGFTAGEVRTMRSILPGLPDASKFGAAEYEAAIRKNYGELADEFLRLYPASTMTDNIFAATRDGFFGWTSQRLVRDQAAIGKPAYLYYFDHGYPAADDAGNHAFHASEVPYMFGTIYNVTALWPQIPDTKVERDLSAAMVGYWSSFAKTGVPMAAGQPKWPVHGKAATYMHFAGKPQVEKGFKAGEYALHEQVVCRRRAAGNVPWNWNVGLTSPALPPAAKSC